MHNDFNHSDYACTHEGSIKIVYIYNMLIKLHDFI